MWHISHSVLTCCILCRSFLSKTPVTNCTSPRTVTCGSRSAARSSTRTRFTDRPAMTPANGRSMRKRPLRAILPPTWMLAIALNMVDWWPAAGKTKTRANALVHLVRFMLEEVIKCVWKACVRRCARQLKASVLYRLLTRCHRTYQRTNTYIVMLYTWNMLLYCL